MRHLLLALLAVFFLSDCSNVQLEIEKSAVVEAPKRPAAKNLSEDVAADRSARVEDVSYRLFFKLDGAEKEYRATETLQFNLKVNTQPLTLDFSEGKILKLQANGREVADFEYNQYFLTLPPSALVVGPNLITIEFSHAYSSTSTGLYRFKDPEDGRFYLYTDLEPYNANSVFPCFDQPDLKARYTVTAEAPSKWTVITNTTEQSVTPADAQRSTWSFPETGPFSTYVFSLHAGEYKSWKSNAKRIPLRLFARQSLAKYVDADEWFRITRQGLKFYQDYYSYPYPFEKYDQLLAPDFNQGAMENVAAVTFSERFVQKGQSTRDEREARASVILHEMAHMWFGDLVTMKWWNDLWLNETFATYMSALAAFEATEFKQAWQSFFRGKQRAYIEDQLVTTHPVAFKTPDTEQAVANFDSLTYSKGASVIKQLNAFLGAENFRQGVRNYLKEHEFDNADYDDFMASLRNTRTDSLTHWGDEWFKHAGLNSVKPVVACEHGKISDFKILQQAPAEAPVLRTHLAKLALYKNHDGRLKLQRVVQIRYARQQTYFPELVGEDCPAFVFLNHDDNDYVKVKIDAESLKTIRGHLGELDESLTRAMIWHSLWEMVRDADLPLLDYVSMVLKYIGKEPEIKIVSAVLDTVYSRRGSGSSVLVYLPNGKIRDQQIDKIENFLWRRLQEAEAGSDSQKLWLDAYVVSARSKTALGNLVDVMQGKVRLKQFVLDQDRRWNVIVAIGTLDVTQGNLWRSRELARDHSSDGVIRGIAAEAALPSLEMKQAWFKKIVTAGETIPLAQLKAAMRNLFPANQSRFRAAFSTEFFSQLKGELEKKDVEFIGPFAASLAPTLCTPASVQGLHQFIAENHGLRPVVLKTLRIGEQEDQRCVRVREKASEPG